MVEPEKSNVPKKNWSSYFNILDVVVLILSIIIPVVLIFLNQAINGCGHHMFSDLGPGAYGWIWGRSLGFTCLIWFSYAMFKGFTVKKQAKLFGNMNKAKNWHCRTAIISIVILSLHIILLLATDPWRNIILARRVEHFPYSFYMVKIWTGIIFGVIMVGSSILFVYLRDITRLRKFGYKKMIWVHRIMLIFIILLAIHVLYINTEIWLATIAGSIDD